MQLDASNDFADAGFRIDSTDLPQHGPDFPLKILRRLVFLPELFPQVVPAQAHALWAVNAAGILLLPA